MNMPYEITIEELGIGWIVMRPALSEFRMEAELEQVPGYLDGALVDWLRMNPEMRVRSTLGVVQGGSTVAIHVWFDEAPTDS